MGIKIDFAHQRAEPLGEAPECFWQSIWPVVALETRTGLETRQHMGLSSTRCLTHGNIVFALQSAEAGVTRSGGLDLQKHKK